MNRNFPPPHANRYNVMEMSTDSQNVIASFEALPAVQQREVIAELLRKVADWDSPPLTDDDLARLADETFLELDHREAADGT